MKWLVRLLVCVLILLAGPAFMATSNDVRLGRPWYSADRSSAGLAPAPGVTPEAVVQIYSARAFSWRGLFAVHTWLATKPAGAPAYTVHQVTGWGLPSLKSEAGIPDRRWFDSTPALLADLRGPTAARAIAHIEQALTAYPFADRYRVWPGPNSNTFTAWMVRHVPELHVQLPSTAVGKDYLAGAPWAATPSGSGYQLSVCGALGLLVARREGVEVNLFGLVWGIDPAGMAIKLPGVGRIGLTSPWPLRRGRDAEQQR
ncbi:DUF3750 domain-containing protein [Salinisphaera aquimarina]|uniref:DUF3750 domain-containing protein n=1 Tax=Salinisphaera aquimarina TaxID=2094031 RepID=A0ABV7EUW3_9GAMM